MSIAFTPQVSGSTPTTQPAATGNAGTKDQTMFLQLLVSELQNQDPTNPVQGTEFVTQLAQFQQVQQAISSGQDLAAMHTDLDQIAAKLSSSSKT